MCNPNDYDLQVTGVDVRLELNGKRLARGLGNKEFTVPRLTESVVSLETGTSMLDIVRQVLGLRTSQEVAYGISGVLHLKDGSLPFENTGVLFEKDELRHSLSEMTSHRQLVIAAVPGRSRAPVMAFHMFHDEFDGFFRRGCR